jgi:hypothetical protein
MKTEQQFVNTLKDNIRERGALSRLLSGGAQVEISACVHCWHFPRTTYRPVADK